MVDATERQLDGSYLGNGTSVDFIGINTCQKILKFSNSAWIVGTEMINILGEKSISMVVLAPFLKTHGRVAQLDRRTSSSVPVPVSEEQKLKM